MLSDIRNKAARLTSVGFRPFVPLGKSVVEVDDDQEEGETEVIGYKPVPMILWLPQIPRGLVSDRTRTSAERGQRLNALAMARVELHLHLELSTTVSQLSRK